MQESNSVKRPSPPAALQCGKRSNQCILTVHLRDPPQSLPWITDSPTTPCLTGPLISALSFHTPLHPSSAAMICCLRAFTGRVDKITLFPIPSLHILFSGHSSSGLGTNNRRAILSTLNPPDFCPGPPCCCCRNLRAQTRLVTFSNLHP